MSKYALPSEFIQVFVEGIFSLTIAGEGRSRDIDLLGNRGEHGSGNLFPTGCATRLQQVSRKSNP
jgi:hypothetical protein